MKKILLATVALTVLAVPALAADLAVKAPAYKAPPPIRVFSWTGCYIGGNVGGVWVHKEWTDHQPLDPFFGRSDGSHDPNSWIAGIQGGCDYQFAGGFVVGIAADYDWSNANASNASILFPGFTNSSKVKNLASVTGRIGYAWDRFLGYVKGGGAWERDDHLFTNLAGTAFGTASVTRSGWTVGVGGEYAFTDWLSGFAEYDYYSFGDRDVTFVCTPGTCGVGNAFTYGIKETKSVFKVGLNVRWGGGYGPVTARY
jgi:outer membrane immunogenic protein